MKLKKFLNITETRIETFLKNRGFHYESFDGYDYGWKKCIVVDNPDMYEMIIHCNLNDLVLTLSIGYWNKQDYVRIDIPKELVEKDDEEEFIDWLDEACEPYFGDSEGN